MLSLSVRGFLDYAGPSNPLAIAWLLCYLPPTRNEVGILIYGLFAAQWPRPPTPLSTLQAAPRGVACKTRGQDGFATSFPVGLLHPLQHAGLSRRTPGCPSLGNATQIPATDGSVLRITLEHAVHSAMPPDTSILCPFTQRFSSERSAAIIGPISSGTPARPSAVISATRLLISGLSRTLPPLKSVWMAPGATTFAVMPLGPSSLAK